MASTIITKYSGTASAVPVSGDLTQGELAVNTADKRLFTKNGGGTVVELGTNPASLALPNGTANGVAYLNGSKVLTTGSALTFDGTSLSVGTSSHPSTLAVYAATGGSTTGLTVNASGNMLNLFGSSSTNAGVIFDATDGTVGSATGVPMIYRLGGTEGMRLTSTGLGIGTSSPTSKLEIKTAADKITQFLSGSGTAVQWQTINDAKTANVPLAISTLETYFFTNGLERMRLDSSGNLGLGVTPSAWSTGKAFEIGHAGNAIFDVASSQLTITQNAYYNGGYKYGASTNASRYDQGAGQHIWFNAPSGTAGNAITFTQAMTLDASGRLAIGTTTAGENLTINSANAANARIGLQYNSSALTYFGSYSGIVGAGNATDTMLAATGVLAFAAGGTTERARIDTSGNLLVGTTSSTTTPANGVQLNNPTTNSTVAIGHASGTASGNYYVNCGYAGTSIGSITQNGTTGVLYNVTSDQRLKENIQDADSASELIDSLQVRQFDWKTDGNHQRYGFVAQELVTVAPEAVHQPTDPDEMMAVDYSKLVPMLVKEIQSLRKRVAQLEGK